MHIYIYFLGVCILSKCQLHFLSCVFDCLECLCTSCARVKMESGSSPPKSTVLDQEHRACAGRSNRTIVGTRCFQNQRHCLGNFKISWLALSDYDSANLFEIQVFVT